MFRACALLTPFYRLDNKDSYKKLPAVRLLNWLKPLHMLRNEATPRPPEYLAKWGHLIPGAGEASAATPRVIMIWEEEQWVSQVTLKESKIPFYAIKAELEDLVCNDAVDEWISYNKNPLTKIETFYGVDHSTIIYDPIIVSTFVRNTIAFFN
jgi:hypothetical protein